MSNSSGRLGGWAVRHAASLLLVASIVLLTIVLVHRGSDILQQIPYVPDLQQPQLLPHEQIMIEDIRANYLKPPSYEPYNLQENLKKDPSRGQTKVILEALKNMRNGFFVECGALDGETRSNTLFMERFLGWTGLLVEADPSNFRKVLSKKRNAWSVNVCLNSRNVKSQVRFKPAFNVGKIARQNASGTVEVDCFPLHALLLALDVRRVDYFSLDVEGAELDVLRTVPFDRIDIRTLSVEFAHTSGGGKPALRAFMESKGYTVIREVKQKDWTANDFIFVKNDTFSEEERQRLSAPYRRH
ncbi:uncharacterized protein LOC122367465 [Amphibalanus amphitrite]|uniref:uncharacterized protein LOC122367465 n=1 Tax=Amphibalanus amphitrite TaxID=1232801 RepID=UPI001C910142|nr:uncharacterized protein LOC122367465 [Amphibalanus amphitrite]XP_043196495.1 uncharacterized protein LOC122367465 [Amphibalanus amphitrite]